MLTVEDLSDEMIPQEELDSYIGMKGETLIEAGFELNGYTYSDEETVFFMNYGLFDYAVEVEERVYKDDTEPIAYTYDEFMTGETAGADYLRF